MKEITALELRKRFGEVMEDVRYRKEPYLVKRNGRPMIVLLDIDAYQADESRRKEDVFIEDYTEERLQEFLEEDRLDPGVQARVNRRLR
ncbi:MAG TPA: hypothetical protein DDX89_01370 [Candidatus Omnitrophica bacterium]|nr:MAG: hypothetical protein A2Z92_06720 [Omnitrophica WOR_2 bacterium GWA2_63_20]OGX18618.1 MAG: hypothetical protein A2105_07025 [Omnitrophica WOR_2 bacterium GWF2_63_9]OGX33129.1 MAG: hypothetical protein A3E56_02210 [Omnitrophica WOR_2 bacterium RIFCSPHIGHO2_12_FULL_64_13]OGX36243.1 MAG: hypothetical protein A3B73_06230 [Omnitrophica WOR_2 bacterium RIFCSPHIGHO2_02_FULL_63_39]OGX46507.1 MAG: hypothetical protein A3I71_04885 [Omnitrophica WOR_2 bacterium RIFCSPLOWO2_02_FULL_63_16]OGX47490.1